MNVSPPGSWLLAGLALILAQFTGTTHAQAPPPPTACNSGSTDVVLTGAVGSETPLSVVGYTANSDCKWLLQCGAGESVRMSFSDFNVHEWSAPTLALQCHPTSWQP